MSLFEKYACLYNERKFNDDERAEIGEFVAGIVKHAGDKEALSRHIDQHLAYVPHELLEKIGRLTTFIAFRGEPREKAAVDRHITKEAFAALEKLSPYIEKEAGIADKIMRAFRSVKTNTGAGFKSMGRGLRSAGGAWKENWQPIMGALALGGVAAPVIASGVKAITQSSNLKNSLGKLLRQHPELRNDPNVAHYFQILTTFAPHVAQNPILAGNLLKRWHETGPDLITPNMIKELLDIENQSGNIERTTQDQVNVLSKTMMGMAGSDFGGRRGKKSVTNIFQNGGSNGSKNRT
jgi:hypothetical protein